MAIKVGDRVTYLSDPPLSGIVRKVSKRGKWFEVKGQLVKRLGKRVELPLAVPSDFLFREQFDFANGSVLVHHEDNCRGKWCCIHKPMPGPWDDWTLIWRMDRGIAERICPHGTGHPAVEQAEFWEQQGRSYEGVHGCDMCPCSPKFSPEWVQA